MKKGTGGIGAWYGLLALLCVIGGVGIGLRWKLKLAGDLTALKINAVTFPIALIIIFSLVTWFITYQHIRRSQSRQQKELAKKVIRQLFNLLCSTNRLLDNIDAKYKLAINNPAGDIGSSALAYELQSIRGQLIEAYHSLDTSIGDWRDILADEFTEIEKQERLHGMLVTEQMIKSLKLKELEKDKICNEKEIMTLKTDLIKLSEKVQTSRARIINESRNLVGAPVVLAPQTSQFAIPQIVTEQASVKNLYLDEDAARELR